MLALVSSLCLPVLPTRVLPVLAQSAPLLNPTIILILCVVAGLGTVMLLPGHRETSFRQIGGVILLAAGLIFFAMMVRYAVGGAGSVTAVYFWIFSTIAVLGALRVVTHPRPVYSAL